MKHVLVYTENVGVFVLGFEETSGRIARQAQAACVMCTQKCLKNGERFENLDLTSVTPCLANLHQFHLLC